MTYSRHVHAAAVDLIRAAQTARRELAAAHPDLILAGWDIPAGEESRRALESAAPENTGTDVERLETLTNRTRLAAVATRSAARRATMTGATP